MTNGGKEKFGRFVLLEQTERSGLGGEYRAARLGATGFEKLVSVIKLSRGVCSKDELVANLMQQLKLAAQLRVPGAARILGIGRIDADYYVSYELIEGTTLKTILERGQTEAFPLAIDHALLIASKLCSVLELAHARKREDGSAWFHGFLVPASVLVSYDGEVRLRGFGYWPGRVLDAGVLSDDELSYLAPEQGTAGSGDARSDVFGVGAVLLASLLGQAPLQNGRGEELAARVPRLRLNDPSGGEEAIPAPIAEILQRALAPEPAARYPDIEQLRKAVDKLLFAGDFAPTTFNLAFFMHTLFRQDIERESTQLREESQASYLEFFTTPDVGPATATAGPAADAPASHAHAPSALAGGPAQPPQAPTPGAAAGPAPTPVADAMHVAPPAQEAAVRAVSENGSTAPRAVVAGAAQGASAAPESMPQSAPSGAASPAVRSSRSGSQAGAGARGEGRASRPSRAAESPRAAGEASEEARTTTPGKSVDELPSGRNRVLLAAAALVVVLIGAAGLLLLRRGSGHAATPSAPSAPTTLSAETVAAMQRVQELEARLAALGAEKAAAEARAAEEAKQTLEAEAKARQDVVDPAAVAKAQQEAARAARLEFEKKQKEQEQRLEEERRAEQARVAEEQKKAEEAKRLEEQQKAEEAARQAAQAPATTLPAVRPGSLVNLTDPGVTAPVALERPQPPYPTIARQQRIQGAIELNLLVDEKGRVVEVRTVSGASGPVRGAADMTARHALNEAALAGTKKWKYRPATKDGVPVKVWLPARVVFGLAGEP